MGRKNIELELFEEVFTSKAWLVRLYKRKPRPNREGLTFVAKNIFTFPLDPSKVKKEIAQIKTVLNEFKIGIRKDEG